MLTIDGSQGEGGGQILRTALALSLVTGIPFRIGQIRARRRRPGLLRQHLTAVDAAARIGRARLEGAALGSGELVFSPDAVVPGEYRFDVGSAGSATLVLQAVLPALIRASGSSELLLEGGTHNPLAPTFEFLERAFLPLLSRLGPRVEATLERPGFFPAGGGRLRVRVDPALHLRRFELLERGALLRVHAFALVSRLPLRIARRELEVLRNGLELAREDLSAREDPNSVGPGNVVWVEVESRDVTEVITGVGQRGVPPETVAAGVLSRVREYLSTGAPVGKHLADQLLLPLALDEGGRFVTSAPTSHTRTNAEILKLFLPVEVSMTQTENGRWLIDVAPRKTGGRP